ncbi:hypothetical protein DDE18_08095 [Nocardioides gansuensis]|uniref:Galactose oxidase n=1 Tax=Nocardioides gansuensis TaxID=2138300 RepID=A0A2T8FC19_9ACTN|nr:hypothetical protein [Nocardioides gansuensis]PVG83250.1 hypothetical protein DDE18_08095 [Nocardioides gansuensis]
MPVRLRATGCLAAASLALTSCTASDSSTDSDQPVEVAWEEVQLPAHPGAPGRVVGRSVVHCADQGTTRWYVVGAVFLARPTEDQDTRPAAWISIDGTTWAPVPIDASTFWGQRAILNSAACSEGRLAAVGARSGGGHGNPRVTTFDLRADGVLVDVQAPFNLYGGVHASNVGPISGGPQGWLIAGNRVSGPAVWVTDDPSGFTLLEGVPGLADDDRTRALAQAGTWSEAEGWVVVGGGTSTESGRAVDYEPFAWVSRDGTTWTRERLPGTQGYDDAVRVVPLGDGLVAVGISGDGFAAWKREDGDWAEPVAFGSWAADASAAPYVASLVTSADGLLATVSDGSAYQLWRSVDGTTWRQVEVPVQPRTAADHALAVAASPDEPDALLVTDDGAGLRMWRATRGTGVTATPCGR